MCTARGEERGLSTDLFRLDGFGDGSSGVVSDNPEFERISIFECNESVFGSGCSCNSLRLKGSCTLFSKDEMRMVSCSGEGAMSFHNKLKIRQFMR